MKCPYCENEMKKGTMSGDGRTAVRWKEGESKAGLSDAFHGRCKVMAAIYSLSSFSIEAYYCPKCKKMIFDTEIS